MVYIYIYIYIYIQIIIYTLTNHISIYIYIYILFCHPQNRPVSFYQNSSLWLERLDSRSWDRNPVDSNANPRSYHSATRKPAQAKEI